MIRHRLKKTPLLPVLRPVFGASRTHRAKAFVLFSGWSHLRPLHLLTVFSAAASIALCLGCARQPPEHAAYGKEAKANQAPIAVKVAEAAQRQFTVPVELTANLAARRRTMIISEVDGTIQSLPPARQKIEVELEGRKISELLSADIGIPVRKGDVLVQLDPRDFELQVEQARAALEKARRDLAKLLAWRRAEEVERLKAARDAAAAQYEEAQADLGRIRGLIERGAASQSDLDRAIMRAKTAQAALRQAEAELKEAEAGPTPEQVAVAKAAVALAEAQLKLAQNRLAKTTIRAPYDGVITDRFVDIGDRVSPMPRVNIMELMDVSILVAEVAVPQRYNGRVAVGDIVSLWAEGLSRPVPALVALINQKVDVETRAFRIRIAVDNRKGQLKAGQLAFVTFQMRSKPSAVTVPTQAIVYDGGLPYVFVLRENSTLKRVPVKVGISNDKWTEVLQGLKVGESVVTYDPTILADGAKVRVVERQTLASKSSARVSVRR